MSRCSSVTPGIICRKPAINSSPASCSAANGIADRLSRMNRIRSASALNRVLPPWRQSQHRHPVQARGGLARLLAGTQGPNMIELWRWEMAPGEAYASGGHPTGTFELLHVERGVLSLAVEQTELRIAPGCSAVAKTDGPHRYANEGEDTLIFTMTVAELHA